MARASRPVGFAMTYRPVRSQGFAPPLLSHVPALFYLAAAVGIVIFVMVGIWSDPGSWLFRYVVEADSQRILGSRPLAGIMMLSALAAVARVRMGGVVVHPDGVEARDMRIVGLPRVRKFAWAQIDCVVLDAAPAITLELWDGRHERLPAVSRRDDLATVLERVAVARAIPVRGGTGMVEPEERDE